MTTRAWYGELIFAAVAIVFVGVLACFSGILRHDGTCAKTATSWAIAANLTPPEACKGVQQ